MLKIRLKSVLFLVTCSDRAFSFEHLKVQNCKKAQTILGKMLVTQSLKRTVWSLGEIIRSIGGKKLGRTSVCNVPRTVLKGAWWQNLARQYLEVTGIKIREVEIIALFP